MNVDKLDFGHTHFSTFSQAAPVVSLATAGNLGDTGGDMLQSVGVARA